MPTRDRFEFDNRRVRVVSLLLARRVIVAPDKRRTFPECFISLWIVKHTTVANLLIVLISRERRILVLQ